MNIDVLTAFISSKRFSFDFVTNECFQFHQWIITIDDLIIVIFTNIHLLPIVKEHMQTVSLNNCINPLNCSFILTQSVNEHLCQKYTVSFNFYQVRSINHIVFNHKS